MAELSDAQFEQLVGMLANNRVAITTLSNEISLKFDDLKLSMKMHAGSLTAIEEDLSKVQAALRQHDQYFEGITQLTKTSYDLIESLQRHVHGESGNIQHGELAESPTQ